MFALVLKNRTAPFLRNAFAFSFASRCPAAIIAFCNLRAFELAGLAASQGSKAAAENSARLQFLLH
jgi:hypothetical protein